MEYSIVSLLSQASATRSLKGVVGMTTTKQDITIDIEAGPSREELLDAFKYAYDEERSFEVTFTGLSVRQTGDVRQNLSRGKFTAKIVGLTHEDGSGQSFIIDAYVSVKPLKDKLVKFYYNAKWRTGHLDAA